MPSQPATNGQADRERKLEAVAGARRSTPDPRVRRIALGSLANRRMPPDAQLIGSLLDNDDSQTRLTGGSLLTIVNGRTALRAGAFTLAGTRSKASKTNTPADH